VIDSLDPQITGDVFDVKLLGNEMWGNTFILLVKNDEYGDENDSMIYQFSIS